MDHTHLTLPDLMRVSATGQPDVFNGRTESYGVLGIYGGHFLGQALAAGLATVDEPKLAHSFHAYFLKGGNPNAQLDYHVTRLREGRGNEVRAITARQEGQDVFHMVASFKLPEEGDTHQPTMPATEGVEALIAAREARGEPVFPFPVVKEGRVQMEFATKSFREFDPERDPVLRLWMRVPESAGLDARTRQVLLAFLSDGTLMFNSVLPYGVPFQSHRLTSLDQSVWFHADADTEEWMLFDQRSTAAADGRGMNSGEVFTREGALVMTCAQESMLRRL
jgi:acyl-CoA thioesterase-2